MPRHGAVGAGLLVARLLRGVSPAAALLPAEFLREGGEGEVRSAYFGAAVGLGLEAEGETGAAAEHDEEEGEDAEALEEEAATGGGELGSDVGGRGGGQGFRLGKVAEVGVEMLLVGGEERAVVGGGVVGGMRWLRREVAEASAFLEVGGCHVARRC